MNPPNLEHPPHNNPHQQPHYKLWHQLTSYANLSILSAFSFLFYAFYTRVQFYPSMVYLGTSKLAYLVLGNASIAISKVVFSLIVKVFLGNLRQAERDAVGDGLRWNLTELCIGLTIFRDEMSNHHNVGRKSLSSSSNHTSGVLISFMFLSLIVTKCLHWAVEIRGLHNQHLNEMDDPSHGHHNHDAAVNGGDEMEDVNENENEQDENVFVRTTFLSKVLELLKKLYDGNSFLALNLLFWDIAFSSKCILHMMANGPSLRLLFAFEYGILAISASTTLWLHVLHVLDMQHQTEYGRSWNTKGVLVLATELWADALKFVFYLSFFTIVFSFYGMPLNMLRDLFISFSNLKKRISVFLKYRELTRNMNQRFRNATDQELEECGHVCIICRDTMDNDKSSGNPAKVLPCGHVFHFYCLRSWLQQQQSCPTCRRDIPKDACTTSRAELAVNDESQESGDTNNQATLSQSQSQESSDIPVDGNEVDNHNSLESLSEFIVPQVWKVVNPDGGKVYPEETLTENLKSILRILPEHQIIVCTTRCKSKSALLPGESMLRIPDGWVCESDVEPVQGVDLSRFAANNLSFPTEVETIRCQNAKNELISMHNEIQKLKDHLRRRMANSATLSETHSE